MFEEKGKFWDRAREIYQDLLAVLGKECAKALHAWANFESRAGNCIRSRQLFRATLECPVLVEDRTKTAPTCQAWVLAEKRTDNIEGDRKLFGKGAEADLGHAYVWKAWGVMESQVDRVKDARRVFVKGFEKDPNSAPELNAWARVEASNKCYAAARHLYAKMERADPVHTQS